MQQQVTTLTPSTDAYALLGVTAQASLALIERIYWKRTHLLLQAEGEGEPDAHARIEALNAAHALVREVRAPAVSDNVVTVQPSRRGIAGAVLAGTAVCALGLGATYGPAAGALAFAVGAVATLTVGRRTDVGFSRSTTDPADAFATLHLAPGADAAEIEIAYEFLRDSTLAEGSDRDAAVLVRLQRLQSAYQSAVSSGGTAYRRS